MPPKPASKQTTGAFLRDYLTKLIARLDNSCGKVPQVEAVHAVRVSCRRLRSIISLFRDYMPPEAQGVRERLRELAAAFSAVRDLDVLLEHLEVWRGDLGGHDTDAFDPVIERLTLRRADLLSPADAALAGWRMSSERRQLVTSAQQARGWPSAARAGIGKVAPVLLETAHGKFRKALERARRRSTLERYHKLRINGKKLRYALQALSGHYGKPAKPTQKALAAIQDGFGDYLDATRAADVLSELCLEPGWKAATRRVCAAIVTRCRDKAHEHLEQMPALLEQLDEKRWAAVLDALTGRKKRNR